MSDKIKVLAVDDEEFNLDIITDYLTTDGYEVIGAEDGAVALQKLEEHPDVDVIVLDRMMPNMNGIEFLNRVKVDDRFKNIPVIMQTAAAADDQVMQGIEAGVFYYLTKPYEEEMLLGIVRSASDNVRQKKEVQSEIRKYRSVLGLMNSGVFRFRTLDEAKNLAYFMANCFPDPEMVAMGLIELLVNAVEHGNLGITYGEKTKLVLDGVWHEEVDRRLALPENKEKFGYLTYESNGEKITVHIKDQGKGFDWQKYLEISPDRATDPHGRGIATSRMISFHSMEYLGAGNEVLCTVNIG